MHKTLKHLIKYQKIYLMIILILVLTLPNLLRWTDNNPTLIGAPSYYYLNVIKEIDSFTLYDNLYLSLLAVNFNHSLFFFKLIPFILGILSTLLLINIIKKLGLSPKNQFFFLTFLILSPAFIYTFTVLNHYSLFIFLLFLGFFLLLNQNNFLNHLSWPVFLIIPFFDISSSLLTLLLLGAYYWIKKDPKIKIPVLVVAISALFNFKKPLLLGPYHSQDLIINFFSDLGGLFGISLLVILLASIGILATWKSKNAHSRISNPVIFRIPAISQPF